MAGKPLALFLPGGEIPGRGPEMTPERYQRLCELFDRAQAQPPDRRAAFLDEVGAADPALAAELQSMLADDRKAQGEQLLQGPCPVNAKAILPGEQPTVPGAPPAGEPDDALVGRRVGPYLVEQRVGDGGMGTVYRALRQGDYRQQVALKVIRPGLDSGELLRRFRTERQVLAELAHPHVARLLDGGSTPDGRPYFVMEYIDGQPLDRFCEARRLSTAERVRLLLAVCGAVGYAHGRGVLHRDLKPDNVLVTADGTPKVTDFGLAKRLEGAPAEAATQTGAVMGTPSYMAPEQAGGRSREVGPATDVYALGAILYELLTGRPPFRAETPLDTLLQVLETGPVPPGRLHPGLARDLETICLKCLHKEPARRYPTVAALAEDLRRFLAGEPIRARPAGRAERLWRWVRRHPARAAAAACALAALVIAGVLARQAYLADQQRRGYEERLRDGERQRAEERAQAAAMSGDADGAAAAIDEAEARGASPGRMHLLRGQVAFHQGDVEAAYGHLEQAVRLLPDSVAARAMLALACYHSGRGTRYGELELEVGAMEPRTPEDFLFKGQAESLTRPEQALQTLDRAVSLRNSVIGWAARLEARFNHALFTDDATVARQALDDARVAKEMLPGSPVILARSVHAHLVAAGVFEVAGQPERGREAVEQAGRDARALEAFPAVPMAQVARFHYYDYVGDEPAALAVSGLCGGTRRSLMLYRNRDYKGALAAADRAVARGSGVSRIERGFILAEMPDDGPGQAWRAFEDARAANDLGYFRLVTATIPLLLGRKPDAVRASREARDDPTVPVPPWYRGWYHRYLDYLCDLISEDELLRAAGRCRPMLCEAHFQIGLRHLADRDRPGARHHFEKCSGTRVFLYWDHKWARAFLGRLEEPGWPPWIGRPKP
jgi:tetratricopeptide (TPR) repeat protein